MTRPKTRTTRDTTNQQLDSSHQAALALPTSNSSANSSLASDVIPEAVPSTSGPWVRTSTRGGPVSEEVIKKLKAENHHRFLIWFYWRRGLSVAEAHAEIEEGVPGLCCAKTVARWYSRAAVDMDDSKVSFDDLPRSGRPKKIKDVQPLLRDVEEDGEQSSRCLASRYNVSHTTICRLLGTFGFSYRLPLSKPYQITREQMQQRAECCKVLVERWDADPDFSQNIVTCDESMLRLGNTFRRRTWTRRPRTLADYRARRLQRQQRPASGPKAGTRTGYMLSLFWHRGGLIHYEILDAGVRLNAALYQQQLEKVAIKLKMTPAGPRKYLLHDNCTAHTARSSLAKAEELGFDVLNHPPYSPDIAPTDYHFFRSFKTSFKQTSYPNVEQVRAAFETITDGFKKDFWERGIDSLRPRWQAVINTMGDYPDFDDGEHLIDVTDSATVAT